MEQDVKLCPICNKEIINYPKNLPKDVFFIHIGCVHVLNKKKRKECNE